MKKLIITLILISAQLLGNQLNTETKIMDKIFYALTQKNRIKVFADNKNSIDVVIKSSKMFYKSSCNDADIIYTNSRTLEKCDKDKLIFSTDYLSFKSLPTAIGAFFYQKGRPNIIFRKEILEKHNIKLSKEFSKYID